MYTNYQESNLSQKIRQQLSLLYWLRSTIYSAKAAKLWLVCLAPWPHLDSGLLRI